MEDVSDVFCINCEDMIEWSKINNHSLVCTAPTSQVIKLISCTNDYRLQFKLSKLKISVESLVYCSPLPWDIKQKLEYLIKKIYELLQITQKSMDSVSRSSAISCKLRKLSLKLPINYSLYCERARMLSIEKTYSLTEGIQYPRNSLPNPKHDLTQSSLAGKRIKFRRFSSETLDDLNSQANCKPGIRGSVGSYGDDPGSSDIEKKNSFKSEFTENFGKNITGNKKKYFYSQCLFVKREFPSRHPAQYIQIQELYSKMLEDHVPTKDWEDFIRKEFSHPERWVNTTVIPAF